MNAVKVSSPYPARLAPFQPPLPASDGAAPHPEAVYTRTLAGHQEVLLERTLLDPAERRLLRMVTGLTPLAVLAPQASGIADPLGAAARLLEVGLIEPVALDAPAAYHPN